MIHSILFTAQAFRDAMLQDPCGEVARYHLAQCLSYLQQSLDDEKNATTDTNMYVVVSLATSAAFLGDLESAKKHMDGLYQMVRLRGGLASLGPGSMLEYKTQR